MHNIHNVKWTYCFTGPKTNKTCIMTSWHERAFWHYWPLWMESPSHLWINDDFRCVLCCWSEQPVEQTGGFQKPWCWYNINLMLSSLAHKDEYVCYYISEEMDEISLPWRDQEHHLTHQTQRSQTPGLNIYIKSGDLNEILILWVHNFITIQFLTILLINQKKFI